MNKIKFYRYNFNLTQKELAQKIGVTVDYISQIERGKRPGIETALKLAQFFNTTIEDLFLNKEIKVN